MEHTSNRQVSASSRVSFSSSPALITNNAVRSVNMMDVDDADGTFLVSNTPDLQNLSSKKHGHLSFEARDVLFKQYKQDILDAFRGALTTITNATQSCQFQLRSIRFEEVENQRAKAYRTGMQLRSSLQSALSQLQKHHFLNDERNGLFPSSDLAVPKCQGSGIIPYQIHVEKEGSFASGIVTSMYFKTISGMIPYWNYSLEV